MPIKNREERLIYAKDWREAHKELTKAYSKEYHQKHKDTLKKRNIVDAKAARQRNKKKVFDHYGWKCKCCGETASVFLTIDHINNDGADHRRKIGRGDALYYWLIKNNFPEGFQTLCRNCNWAKRFDVCPHQKEKNNEL